MKRRPTVDNPDSQFVAMPQTITPAGIELNPQTEPLQKPNLNLDTTVNSEPAQIYENIENNENIIETKEK